MQTLVGDPNDLKRRAKAAMDILSASTTTIDKVRSVKTLIHGVSPRIDALLAEIDGHLRMTGMALGGEVIELAADKLPETTDEEKRRKKILLLFIKGWGELKSEVARVQAELNNQQSGAQGHTSTWYKILSGAKGPLAIITVVAISIAVMASTSVDVVIHNNGCGTLVAKAGVPVSLPGLKLPNDSIDSGESATATIPPLPLTIDGTVAGKLTLHATVLNYTIDLGSAVKEVTFDGVSLLGTKTDINLSGKKSHDLVLICK